MEQGHASRGGGSIARAWTATEVHALLIGSIAAVVLFAGWGFGIELAKSIFPGFPTTKAVTALSLMLLSLSCLTSLRVSRGARWLAVGTGLAVPAILLLAFALIPPGLQQRGWTTLPSEGTATCLSLAGVAIALVTLRPAWAIAIAVLSLISAAPALYRIFGLLLFGGAPTTTPSPLDTMALPTAALIFWFNLACVLMHPSLGFRAAVFRRSLRGRMLRQIIPLVGLLPIVAAAASLALSLMFGWPVEVLLAEAATLYVILGAGAVWRISALLERLQAEANEHAASLSRANEALERYASTAAHDLKAPARHVLVYTDYLDLAVERGDMDGVRKFAKRIRESAADMPPMVDRMLAYSRSAYTRLHPSDCMLSELVQAAASMLEDDLAAAGARIVLGSDMRLSCDPSLAATIFQNLISNSLRNARRGVHPEIVIDAMPEGSFARITVADNGRGFDPKLAGLVFNPLARAPGSAEEGLGIGLATCRTIVQSHGGQIRIDPASVNGAIVEFTLPLASRETRGQEPLWKQLARLIQPGAPATGRD
jgi:signal transduction histidine kinase